MLEPVVVAVVSFFPACHQGEVSEVFNLGCSQVACFKVFTWEIS